MKKLISVLLTTAMLISILSVGTSAANVIEGSVSTEIISPENPAHPYLPEPGPNEPNWGSGYNSTHQFITGNAINLIRNAVSSYPLSSYTTTLKTQSDWPDSSDESKSRGENDAGLFLGHFYDPTTGKTWDDSTSPNAKIRLTNNYQRAVSAYKAGNKANAMSYLAFALHYAADLSTPHHAANVTATNASGNHTAYENWVKNNQNSYVETSLSASTLTWAKNTSIGDMGHNFAVNARTQINNAMSSSTFATAASNTLPKAQRNCAAVIYKFLVDVGAVS